MKSVHPLAPPAPHSPSRSTKSRSPAFLSLVLRTGILLAALFVVIRAQMVETRRLIAVLTEPIYALGALAVLFAIMAIRVIRLRLLLRSQGTSLPFKRLFELSMIAAFFGTFLPGAAGGDAAKVWYLFRDVKEKRAAVLWTVLLDRYLGVVGYLAYSAVSLSLLRLRFNASGLEWLEALCWLGLVSWVGLLTVCGALRAFGPRKTAGAGQPEGLRERIAQTLGATSPSVLTVALGLSLSAALLVTVLFSAIGGHLQVNLSLLDYFVFAPVSIVISVLPIAPNGIGVGQITVYKVLLWGGYADPSVGATILSAFQVYWTAFNLLGAAFYLAHRKAR